MSRGKWWLGVVALCVACGAQDPVDDTIPLGKVTKTATGYRWDLDPFEVAPGTEIQRCVAIEGVDEDIVVRTANVKQSVGGHHLVIFTGAAAVAGTVADCTSAASMAGYRFIAPGDFDGNGDNTAFKIPKGKVVVLQAHYLNATTQPIIANDSYEVHRIAPGITPKLIDFFAFTDVEFLLPPGPSSVTHTCTMDRDLAVLDHFGHMHEYGAHYRMEHLVPGQDAVVLDEYDWAVDFRDKAKRNRFTADAPLMIRTGESLRITCAWNNPKSRDIEFPEEMCVGFFHYLTTEERPGGFLTCLEGTPSLEDS